MYYYSRKINKEHIALLEEETRRWREASEPFIQECLARMRAFVPPSIFIDTNEDLIKAGVSEKLVKRFEKTHCLRLVRMDPKDIARLHTVRGIYR